MKFLDYSAGVALGFFATANIASAVTVFSDYFRFEDYAGLIAGCYVWAFIYSIPPAYDSLKKLYQDLFGIYSP